MNLLLKNKIKYNKNPKREKGIFSCSPARKHGRNWEGAAPASDAVASASVTSLNFVFSDSGQLGSIRADADRAVPNRLRFAPNQADSARIGPYWPYRFVSTDDRYGRNMPEKAKKGRNLP